MKDELEILIRNSQEGEWNFEPNEGHKERFLAKRRVGKLRNNLVVISSIAAMAVLLIAIPFILYDRKSNTYTSVLEASNYEYRFDQKSYLIRERIKLLNTTDRDLADCVLEQIADDPVSIREQLPEEIDSKEKEEILNDYYKTKLDGLDRLDIYINELISK